MRDECSKYGQIHEFKIPRPTGGSRQSAGVGKIFVKFESVESATGALKALAGRKFSDRTVVTTYFSEVSIVHCLLHIEYVLIWSIGKLRRQCLVERWIPWSSKWLINLRLIFIPLCSVATLFSLDAQLLALFYLFTTLEWKGRRCIIAKNILFEFLMQLSYYL